MIGVSRCLLGELCTYSGSHHIIEGLKKLEEDGMLVSVCPEVMGGLPIPRDPAEIQSRHPLTIKTIYGKDVTHEYVLGAQKAMKIFKDNHVDVALLKLKSPSCGVDGVYDGTFTHRLVEGQGVFVTLCQENGIRVFHENELKQFLEYIGKEEEYGTYFKNSTSI